MLFVILSRKYKHRYIEEKKSFLDGICETVLERLGPCTRGEGGGECELKHPPDCTKPACHVKGGRKATGCEGWHLFKKYSELRAERKSRADIYKQKKAAAKKARAPKKSNKGNANPGKKAAPSGHQQRRSKKGGGQPQVLPVGHSEWAVQRPPMAAHGQQQIQGFHVAQPGAHQRSHAPPFYQAPQLTQPGQQQVHSGLPIQVLAQQHASGPQFVQPNPYEVLGNMNY